MNTIKNPSYVNFIVTYNQLHMLINKICQQISPMQIDFESVALHIHDFYFTKPRTNKKPIIHHLFSIVSNRKKLIIIFK